MYDKLQRHIVSCRTIQVVPSVHPSNTAFRREVRLFICSIITNSTLRAHSCSSRSIWRAHAFRRASKLVVQHQCILCFTVAMSLSNQNLVPHFLLDTRFVERAAFLLVTRFVERIDQVSSSSDALGTELSARRQMLVCTIVPAALYFRELPSLYQDIGHWLRLDQVIFIDRIGKLCRGVWCCCRRQFKTSQFPIHLVHPGTLTVLHSPFFLRRPPCVRHVFEMSLYKLVIVLCSLNTWRLDLDFNDVQEFVQVWIQSLF